MSTPTDFLPESLITPESITFPVSGFSTTTSPLVGITPRALLVFTASSSATSLLTTPFSLIRVRRLSHAFFPTSTSILDNLFCTTTNTFSPSKVCSNTVFPPLYSPSTALILMAYPFFSYFVFWSAFIALLWAFSTGEDNVNVILAPRLSNLIARVVFINSVKSSSSWTTGAPSGIPNVRLIRSRCILCKVSVDIRERAPISETIRPSCKIYPILSGISNPSDPISIAPNASVVSSARSCPTSISLPNGTAISSTCFAAPPIWVSKTLTLLTSTSFCCAFSLTSPVYPGGRVSSLSTSGTAIASSFFCIFLEIFIIGSSDRDVICDLIDSVLSPLFQTIETPESNALELIISTLL